MKLNRIFYNKDVINDKYTKTLRRKVTMLVENQCITVRNYITITKENSSDYSKRSCCLSTRHTQWEKKKKVIVYFFVFCTCKETHTFCCWRLLQFLFCYCESTLYLQNFQLDTFQCRQIQIWDTSNVYRNY